MAMNAVLAKSPLKGAMPSGKDSSGILFEFTAVMNGIVVNPKFTNKIVQFSTPSIKSECCCLCRTFETNTVIPRHKLLSYDLQSEECVICSCCDRKSLTILTSDFIEGPIPLPLVLNFSTDPKIPGTQFPADLPLNLKEYIFSPLNQVAESAQLISHMTKDGISEKLDVGLKLTDRVKPAATEDPQVLFEVKMGTRGRGKFSDVKFYPSYVSMVYGNNPKCCYGYLCNPCIITSHEMVKYELLTAIDMHS